MIQQIIDDMDLKTMTQLCYDYLDEGYDKYSDEELISECEEYYPELLEEWLESLLFVILIITTNTHKNCCYLWFLWVLSMP